MPALDGVRAIAVAAVIVFHADLHGTLSGGFLGVSVFFTLSGFLITSLLVQDHERNGRIALGAFYARRVRRLVPAAYVCVAAVLAMGVLWGATQRRDLPGDAIAAVANVANWRFAFATRSYQDLFLGLPSPLAHFWSLAIEEQCYLVLPVVVWWALRRGVRRLAWVLALLVVASLVATLLTHDVNLVYHGTHTRAGELLVGGLAALVFHRWVLPRWVHTILSAAGLTALAVLVQTATLRDQWLYRGGFLLVAMASAALVVGLAGANPVARVVGARPLAAIGRVSYGIYLFHWPVYLVLTRARVGFGGAGLLAMRLAVTSVVVVASYRLVEMPVRAGRALVGRRPALVALAAAALLGGAATVVVPGPRFTATQRLLAAGTGTPLRLDGGGTPSAITSPKTPTVLVLGSETQVVRSLSVLPFHVVDGTQPECPVVPSVEARFLDGRVVDATACESVVTRWPRLLAQTQPDIVVVTTGGLDTGFTRLASDPPLPVIDPSRLGDLSAVLRRAETRLEDALAPVLGSSASVFLYDASTSVNGESVLARVALQSVVPVHFSRSASELFAAVSSAVSPRATSAATRILVIGDSTSLDMASALSQASAGRLDLLWAGANGCPFVRATAARSSRHADWTTLHCEPFDTKLPPIIHEFHPDAVLLVVGPMELQELRLANESAGHVAGDPAFTRDHDAEMAAFRSVLGDLPLVVADAPAIRAGAWATPEMADPARVVAWNALVAHWVADGAPQVRLLPYAAALAGYEAIHGDIRSDGVHPEVGPLTDLARTVLVEELLTLVR